MPGTTRVESGRRRAKAAKRAVALTAAAGFAVVLALARQGHPAATPSTSNSNTGAARSTGASSLPHQGGSSLGGGSLAPSSGGSPSASSQTS